LIHGENEDKDEKEQSNHAKKVSVEPSQFCPSDFAFPALLLKQQLNRMYIF
jgi:hypothetical protein